MNNIYWAIQDKDGFLYRFLSNTKEEAEHTMNYWLKGKDAKPVKVKLMVVADE